jgi:pilus assembly protein FimV
VLSNTYAAGLGKLTVLSSLGQPLRAEIELTSVAADEAGSLVPKLASADAFRQANVDLNPVLLSLRFAVEQRGSVQVIRVTSTQPINEPFVDMLLELGGSKGRLVREYTFLLDPPEMRSQQAAQIGSSVSSRSLPPQTSPSVSRPASAVSSAPAREEARAPRATAKPERVVAVPKQETADGTGTDEYQVKKGDSLAKIAGQFRSEGVSLDQMLVALYRANPDAFVGKNMNRLRAGQILTVPAADDAKSVGNTEAHGVVIAQAADFNSYRNKLAGQVASAAPKQSDDSKQASGGKITTKIQEQSGAANDSKDKLKLSKSGTSPTAGSDKLAGVSAEDLIAKDKAIAEANARVKELEKNVGDLQKLLEIKNRDMADQQKQAEVAKVAPATAIPPAVASAPVAAAPASAAVEASPAAASAVVAEPASAVVAPVIPPVAVKPKPPVIVPPPPPAPGFFEDMTSNGLFLPGAAALLALLAGLGIYSARRRKQPKSFEDSIISDSTLKSNSLFGSTGGQSVDTNNSVFNSNFVPSASQLDTNEVDPIAEADVYIAYGRDAQAEEILKEALRNQPDRHAVRVKLLEIYANRKDVRSFEILATELYGMTKGEGDDWQQAANLGAILDPGNPMYSSNAISGDVASRASALTAPTRPMDEQTMDALLETTHVKKSHETGADTIETSPYFGSTTLLADDAISTPTAPPRPVVAEQESDVVDLDFDLEGLDLESADKKAAAETPQAELPADIAAIDFDFLDKESAAPAATPEADLSFDLDKKPAVPSTAAAPEVLLPEAMGLDFPSSGASSHPADVPATGKLPEFDLSGIALDLDPAADAAPSSGNSPAELPPLDGLDEEHYSSNAEMATKLDLAIAYQEIGDKEGARELLEEVVKGGNPDQADKAKNLLGKLA